MAEFKLKQTAEEVQRAVDNGLSFGDEEVVFADEQTVVFEDGMGSISLNESAVIGANVTVIWDGIQYDCVVLDMGGAPAVGDVGLVSGEVITGEPFIIVMDVNSPLVFPGDPEKSDAVVQINGEKVNKLDEKYLPNDLRLFYADNSMFLYNDPNLSDRTSIMDITSVMNKKFAIVLQFKTGELYAYPNSISRSDYGYAAVEVSVEGKPATLYTEEYTG